MAQNWALFILIGLILALPMLALGALLIRIGHWPKRKGSEPHCPSCEYNLTGVESDRCPECGRLLWAGSIVRGHRDRRAGLTNTGITLVVFGLIAIAPIFFGVVQRINWYQVKPAFLVIRDLESGSSPIKAWDELMRREKAGGLSSANIDRIVELALKEQAAPTNVTSSISKSLWPQGTLLEFVALRDAAGKLSLSQQRRFLTQLARFTLQVRPKIAAGDNVPFIVDFHTRAPRGWQVGISIVGIGIDEKPISIVNPTGSLSTGGIGGGRTGWPLAPVPSGEHKLKVVARIVVYDRAGTFAAPGKPVYEEDRELPAQFTVLPNSPPGLVALNTNEAMGPVIRSAVQLNDFIYKRSGGRIDGMILFTNLPMNVAFDVFARFDGMEFKLGPVVGHRGSNGVRIGSSVSSLSAGSAPLPMPPAKIDIILRSTESVARRTVDLYDIWDGELVFSDVPVIGGRPPSQGSATTLPSSP